MLPDSDAQLLTAYVDGEVSARQRKAVGRLLRRSGEARALLRRLQDDARALRQLSRPQLASDFSDQVLRAIAERGTRPPQPAARPVAVVPLWKVLSAAAAILVAVGASSFLYFSGVLAGGKPASPVVQKNGREKERPAAVKKDGRPVPPLRDTVVDGKEKTPPPERPGNKDRTPPDTVARDTDKGVKPGPPDKVPLARPREDIRTDQVGGMEMISPDRADVLVPALFRLQALKQEAQRKALQGELARQQGLYAEVLCREGTQALPRLQAVLQANGVGLVLDPMAQFYLKNPKLRSHYLLFLEDVTPEELGCILEQLGQDNPKQVPGPFAVADSNLVLVRLTPDHRKKLALYLGADPQPLTAPAGAPAPDLRKRQAVALAYNGVPPRGQSAEVKRFHAGRKPARKGTLQVMLVLRGKL